MLHGGISLETFCQKLKLSELFSEDTFLSFHDFFFDKLHNFVKLNIKDCLFYSEANFAFYPDFENPLPRLFKLVKNKSSR